MEVVAQQLSVMSGTHMAAILGGVSTQATNTAVPLLFPSTSQDVRMSLVADSMSRLSVNQKLDSLLESDEQIPVMIEALMQRLGYKEREILVRSMMEREGDFGTEENHNKGGRVVPEIRLESSEEEEEEEEEREEDWEEEDRYMLNWDEGAVSN